MLPRTTENAEADRMRPAGFPLLA